MPLFLLVLLLLPLPAAAQLFGPSDPADWERLLVPVAGSTPGQFGSVWNATVSAYSTTSSSVVVPYCSRGIVCGYDYYLNDHAPTEFKVDAGAYGAFLYIPKDRVNDCDFVVHVRDDKHPADSNVDVPVVRQSDFHSSIRLLDIPITSGVRPTLRVYGNAPGSVTVTVRDAAGQQLGTIPLQLTGGTYSYNGFLIFPASIADPLTAFGYQTSNVMLDIASDDGAPIWAFVSVTNNDTQHINLIVPFRKN
ncbi:MAG TPA: hypothetical protein VGR95_11255 [Thermoanaerobaculia bacterium]|nr:hypothetical protein [Thermoanaerobaculia bacterium]